MNFSNHPVQLRLRSITWGVLCFDTVQYVAGHIVQSSYTWHDGHYCVISVHSIGASAISHLSDEEQTNEYGDAVRQDFQHSQEEVLHLSPVNFQVEHVKNFLVEQVENHHVEHVENHPRRSYFLSYNYLNNQKFFYWCRFKEWKSFLHASHLDHLLRCTVSNNPSVVHVLRCSVHRRLSQLTECQHKGCKIWTEFLLAWVLILLYNTSKSLNGI